MNQNPWGRMYILECRFFYKLIFVLLGMEIYVGHSRAFDFKEKLYRPIRESCLNNEHNFVLPHESSDKPSNSKEYFENKCDLFIADVSCPATGLGIELGWADALGIPIACVYEKGSKLSGSVKVLCDNFLEYSSGEELIFGIEGFIKKLG